MAGGFLSIGACISALTRNQVVAFVISFVICFAFNLSGFPLVLDFFSGWAPQAVVEAIGSFSFLTHFNSIQKGVIDLRDVIFFATLIALWLYANMLAIEHSKGH
jgi:ABC-2 type transport system permease protein